MIMIRNYITIADRMPYLLKIQLTIVFSTQESVTQLILSELSGVNAERNYGLGLYSKLF
jgi:hypothetical protein